ncbi:ananain-like [Raphanus sativus]|uniref:Ananain-like n=1 Tax=Raphanus sativus TaxID=3726 RepID=A0A6J0LJD1_RAPSA|nr:ananain-like [Raphanus sativus]
MRLKVFKKNLEYIENFNNKGNQSYKLGVNEFTDLIDEEFLATHTGLNDISVTSPSVTMPPRNWNVSNLVGESKDWRKEGRRCNTCQKTRRMW